jgi:hypothetical protein
LYDQSAEVGTTKLTDNLPAFLNQGWNGTTDDDPFRVMGRRWFINFKHSF